MRAYPTLGMSVVLSNKKDYYNFRKAQEKVDPKIPRFSADEFTKYSEHLKRRMIIGTRAETPTIDGIAMLLKYNKMFKRYNVPHKLCVQWVNY